MKLNNGDIYNCTAAFANDFGSGQCAAKFQLRFRVKTLRKKLELARSDCDYDRNKCTVDSCITVLPKGVRSVEIKVPVVATQETERNKDNILNSRVTCVRGGRDTLAS